MGSLVTLSMTRSDVRRSNVGLTVIALATAFAIILYAYFRKLQVLVLKIVTASLMKSALEVNARTLAVLRDHADSMQYAMSEITGSSVCVLKTLLEILQ
jgi:hypothetical protein